MSLPTYISTLVWRGEGDDRAAFDCHGNPVNHVEVHRTAERRRQCLEFCPRTKRWTRPDKYPLSEREANLLHLQRI